MRGMGRSGGVVENGTQYRPDRRWPTRVNQPAASAITAQLRPADLAR